MKPQPMKPVLSVAEAARFLGLSYGTVLKLARNGTLPAKRVGRRHLFLLDTLLRYLNSSPDNNDDKK